MKKLLKAAEAADLLSISESYLYQLAREHRIPAIKLGSAVRFRLEDLENFLEVQARKINPFLREVK